MSQDTTQADRRHPERSFTRALDYAPPELVESISARLQAVCAHLPAEEFAALTRRIAHIQWKYDRREYNGDLLGRELPYDPR